MGNKSKFLVAAAPLALAALGLVPTAASAAPQPCEYVAGSSGPDNSPGNDDDTPPSIVCGESSFDRAGSTVVGRGEVSNGSVGIGQFVIVEPDTDFSDVNISNGAAFPDASVGIGYRARVDGDRNVAVGANSRIGGVFGQFNSVSRATAIGSTTLVLGEGGVAVGASSQAIADGSTVVGTQSAAAGEGATVLGYQSSTASVGGVAIGRNSRVNEAQFGTISTVEVPDLVGGVAVGDRSRVSGNNGLALGAYSVVGIRNAFEPVANGTAVGAASNVAAEGGTALGARTSVTGANGIAIGNGVGVANSGAIAIGANSQASTDNATALGTGAVASGANAVALGAGSVADRDNSVSVGAAGAERQLTNVAAGTAATDAVNLGQLNAAVAGANGNAAAAQTTANDALADAAAAQATAADALANAATAQTTATTARGEAASAQDTADTALADATAAQGTADTAIARGTALGQGTAAALGGGAAYDGATGMVTPPSYNVQGASYADVGSALGALDNGLSQLNGRVDLLELANDRGFRRANGGIAAAMALGGTMIVPDSGVSMSFNLATYRGEQGFSGAVVVRAAPRVYVSGGFAGSTVKGSTGGRVGVAFGF